MPEVDVVRSLFVTLRRGTTGKPWFHRRIIDALGLNRRHDCVEKPNNSSIRGMLMKVPHLVKIETDKMHYYRKMRDYYQDLNRDPITVEHPHAASTSFAAARLTEHAKTQHAEHVHASGMAGFEQSWQPKRPSRYLKELAVKERVKALTEEGLYSQKVKRINERDIAQRLTHSQRKEEA